jgi:hypothetical protein
MRVPLRPQIIFKTTEITYQSELRFLGIYISENLKWGAHVWLLRTKLCKVVYVVKTLKEIMSPYKKYLLYYYGIIWGGDNESNKIFIQISSLE